MKKLKLFSVIVVTMLLAVIVNGLPNNVDAATYAYINSSGNLVYVQANSSDGAFTNSANIATHSGVMLVNSSGTVIVNNPNYSSGYMYVNDFGTVIRVEANTSNGAFTNSKNIATHSGVMMINSAYEGNIVGDHVSGM